MKKKVDYVTVSNELADFLIQNLDSTDKPDSLASEKLELKKSLEELISGQTNSLVLDCENSAVIVLEDVIRV